MPDSSGPGSWRARMASSGSGSFGTGSVPQETWRPATSPANPSQASSGQWRHSAAASIQPASLATWVASPRSTLSDAERSRVGVAHWPDPQFNVSSTPQSMEYGRSFSAAVDTIAGEISNGTLKDLNSIWSRATSWRVSQVPSGSTALASSIRERRQSGPGSSMTPITDRYSYLIDRMKESPLSSRTTGLLGRSDIDAVQLRSTGRLSNGQSIPLTRLVVPFKSESNFSEVATVSEFMRPLMFHTPASRVSTVLSEVEHLRASLPSLASDEEKVSQLGEMHWWLSHAMPDVRGSAAKSELTVRALASSEGLSLPPFRQGVVPDLESFVTSQEDFRSNYASMFERAPTRSAQSS